VSGKFEVVCGWDIIRVELLKGCKEAMEKNTKNALIKTYAIAMFMQTLLDEWSRVERIGICAKIYNRLQEKHQNFYAQIDAVKKEKKKKYSVKCHLFVIASGYAVGVWQSVMEETKGNTISANTVIHNLYRLDAENFSKVYALDEAIFRKLNSKSCGVTLASCKVARLLNEKLQEYIEKVGEIKSIY